MTHRTTHNTSEDTARNLYTQMCRDLGEGDPTQESNAEALLTELAYRLACEQSATSGAPLTAPKEKREMTRREAAYVRGVCQLAEYAASIDACITLLRMQLRADMRDRPETVTERQVDRIVAVLNEQDRLADECNAAASSIAEN